MHIMKSGLISKKRQKWPKTTSERPKMATVFGEDGHCGPQKGPLAHFRCNPVYYPALMALKRPLFQLWPFLHFLSFFASFQNPRQHPLNTQNTQKRMAACIASMRFRTLSGQRIRRFMNFIGTEGQDRTMVSPAVAVNLRRPHWTTVPPSVVQCTEKRLPAQ